jgi:MFS transporter, DHA1 family, tetracycline resistance protein
MIDRKPGKHAFAFIFITALLDIIGFGIIIPVLPGLIMELTGEGISEAVIYGGWLLVIYAGMQFFFAPVIGNLSDHFGRRPVLLVCLFVFGCDYIIQGFAPSILWLFAGRMMAGISGATYPTANAYVADITPEDKRAQAFGLLGAAFGLGFIIGPSIGGLVGGAFGIRAPFFLAAGLAFANMIYGYFVLPETLSKANRRPFNIERANPLGAFNRMRAYPIVLGMMGAVFFYQIAHDANPSTWSYYTIHKFEWTPTQIGWSLAFVGLCIAVVQGALIGKVIAVLGEVKTAWIGLLFASIGFLGFGLATTGWMLYAFVVPFSMMGLSMPAIRSIMSAQVPGDAQGELAGALTSLASLTAIGAPLFMTQLFGYFISEAAPFMFPGAPFVAASLLCILALGAFQIVTSRSARLGSTD